MKNLRIPLPTDNIYTIYLLNEITYNWYIGSKCPDIIMIGVNEIDEYINMFDENIYDSNIIKAMKLSDLEVIRCVNLWFYFVLEHDNTFLHEEIVVDSNNTEDVEELLHYYYNI